MRTIWKMIAVILAATVLLSGCGLLTLEELYCPPKRSEDYDNLQSVIDKAMRGLTYCAPISGENQQAVQTADLDGDGVDEYLLFAQDSSETPLKILIFCQLASGYMLMDTIEGYGFAFEFVEYAQMDDRDGVEIIVSRQVSEELARSVSVYRFTSGFSQQLLSVSCARAEVDDLDGDDTSELLLLKAGESERGNGMLMLYDFVDGEFERSEVTNISQSVSALQRMELSRLTDGTKAVFVTSVAEDSALVVDAFALSEGKLNPVHMAMRIPGIRNYLLFPADMNEDGVLELAKPVEIHNMEQSGKPEYVIIWQALNHDGSLVEKTYTYQQFTNGWYLFLREQWLGNIAVEQTEDACIFYMRQAEEQEFEKVFTIFTLTGSDREEQAALEGRIILYKTESIIFAAKLEEQAGEFHITDYMLQRQFRPIRMERNLDDKED